MLNPLLSNSPLPEFSKIQAAHIEPAIDHLLTKNRSQINKLLNLSEAPTWENLVIPLEKLNNDLNNVWSTIEHLNSVMDTPEFRTAYDAALLKVTEYSTEISQNERLYTLFQTLAESSSFPILNIAQQKVIKNELRDFRLAGIALNSEKKDQFKKLRQELSELESQYAHNVLDATQGWSKEVINEQDLIGIPQHTINSAAIAALKKGKEGWLLTLDRAISSDVLCYAENRLLRKEIYEAYVTRASSIGPNANKWNNDILIGKILSTRQQLAMLLDFNNYAEYSLATKMAKNTKIVMDFLLDLANRSKETAKNEMIELSKFGQEKYNISKIEPWDIKFLSEQLCKAKHSISQEELRQYFPEEQVIAGLFTIAHTLFGIKIVEIFDFDKWHETVRLFKVFDNEGTLRGQFFSDPYHRDGKRDGAWVMGCRDRIQWMDGTQQLPIAYLVTNFSPAELNKEALLKHDDVITLFHEFGHCLHHILTKIDYPSISGTNGVEWDAIELPSQLMENWAWEQQSLELISKHAETGEILPNDIFNKLFEAKNFQSGIHMLNQIEYALFDFSIHLDPTLNTFELVQKSLNDIRQKISVIPISAFNKFQNTFSHIFAGSYAAGYYSYKWAEVLSSDVFATFEEGGIFNATTGERLKSCILEQGGSKDSMDLFIAFKGRPPNIDALLRHSGLEQEKVGSV